MISFQIKNMPVIKIRPLGESMKMIAAHMQNSVRQNFMVGGRPQWAATRWNANRPLWGNGGLFESITQTSGENWAKVETTLPYARTHQQGRSFVPTLAQRNFFWYKFFETADERWKGMAIAAGSGRMFNIPARPFMVIQQEDMDFIFRTLGQGSVQITTEGGAFISGVTDLEGYGT